MEPDRPDFTLLGGYDRDGVRYLWNDTRASKDFALPQSAAEAVATRVETVSARARLGLCTALFEIVARRFEPLDADPYPALLIESAWASLADRRYAHYDERPRAEWLGPVRGPLWCGLTWLGPALHDREDERGEWESTLVYLVRLAHHVVPAREALAAWLDGVIQRLLQHHQAPAAAADPYDDLFGRYSEWRRGDYIARECFDLGRPWDPAEARALMGDYLRGLDSTTNPLLATPAELAAAGFTGPPYGPPPPWPSLRP